MSNATITDLHELTGGHRAAPRGPAARVLTDLGLGPGCAVRLDSGDLGALTFRCRRLLDDAGLPEVDVVASGGLDEYAVADLVAAGAPIDVFSVGTRVGVSADAPYLDSAYKLAAYDGRPVMKPSSHSGDRGERAIRNHDPCISCSAHFLDLTVPPRLSPHPAVCRLAHHGDRLSGADPWPA